MPLEERERRGLVIRGVVGGRKGRGVHLGLRGVQGLVGLVGESIGEGGSCMISSSTAPKTIVGTEICLKLVAVSVRRY